MSTLTRICLLLWMCAHIYAVQVWQTTIDKSKLLARQGDINPSNGQGSATTKVTVNSQTYQEIYGYGAALTESSAINFIHMKQKDNSRYQTVLKSLFDAGSGAGISVVRVPIGSSDFSNAPYFTYDETVNDWLFAHWGWQRDSTYVLPVLKDILGINPNIKILISPWTAPTWMKTSANASNAFFWGEIAPAYFDDFAFFFQFTIQKFKAEGINIYALTLQNEPQNEPNSYPVMRMSVKDQIQVAALLGPKLKTNNINTKILVWDHNWDQYQFPIDVLADSSAYPYIAGSAFHCYAGSVSAQSNVYKAHPDKEIWFTECSGTGNSNFAGNLPWNTNNLYIGSVQNWARTVLHWNLALDNNNGPKTSGGCTNCRGVITVGSDSSTVTYNEEYYGLAMFGKFLKYPAYRIDCSLDGGYNCVNTICFKNSDGSHVIVVHNYCQTPQAVVVQGTSSSYVSTTAPVGLTSFVW